MKPSDMAPAACIVCGKKHPGGDNAPGWTYLAGAKPLGAIACSLECTNVAALRMAKTGRVDAPGEERGACAGCGLVLIVNTDTRTISHEAPLCDAFKARLSGKRVEQSLELRDERGNLVPTRKGEA